jgi:hypothetical protein
MLPAHYRYYLCCKQFDRLTTFAYGRPPILQKEPIVSEKLALVHLQTG